MTDQSDYCSQDCKAACCHSVNTPPFDPDAQGLVSWDRACSALDAETGLCTCYADRPPICRDPLFEPGGRGCEDARKAKGLGPYAGPGASP